MEFKTVSMVSFICLAIATILPLFNSAKWWVRVFEFPRLQWLVWALITNVSIIIFWSGLWFWLLFGVCTAIALYHLKWILPYLPLYPAEVASANPEDTARTLSILSANVLMTNQHYPALIALIKQQNPDIFVTLESDQHWQDAIDQLEPDYPFSVKAPQDDMYGMHLYSRLPLSNLHLCYLVKDNIPSVHCMVTLASGQRLNLRIVHPMPPSPTESDVSSDRDAELIIVGETVAKTNFPTIVSGDLNDVAWSRTTRLFRNISGLKDPRIGRGLFNTFHAAIPVFRWPLDHVFHSGHFELITLKRLKLKGSDHFSLFVKLSLETHDTEDNTSRSEEETVLELERLAEQQASTANVPDLN